MEDEVTKDATPRSAEELITEDEFINLYLQGLTIYKIAKLLGVRRETIWKWKKRPEVQEKMREARTRLRRGIEVVEKPRRGRPSKVFADFEANLPQAVAAFVATGTISGAAARVGVSRDKFSEWRKHPAFQAAMERAGNNLLSKALSQIESDCVAAARTLREIMNDTNANVFARLNAAKSILEIAMKSTEWQSLKVKIRKLEEVAGISQVSEIEGNMDSIARALPQRGREEVTVDVG